MALSLKEAWCKVAEWCENPPWVGLPDLDEQTLSVDTDSCELAISNGNSIPISDIADCISASEPVQITCAALRALAAGGGLTPGQEYLVTDYNRGTVGAATILTHAVTASSVSWDVAVATTFDDSAWMARWCPTTCRIVDMFDNLGNKIRSDNGDEIDVFPWGNSLVTGNTFTDVDFNYNGGTVRDNSGSPTARLDTSGGATVTANTFASRSIAIINDATLTETELAAEGRAYLDGTAILNASRVGENSYVDFDALNVTTTRFDSQSILYGDGAIGNIGQSSFDRGYIDVRDAPNVDIDDLSLSGYSRVAARDAQRVRLYRSTASDDSYFQVTAGSAMVANRTNLSAGSYSRSLAGGTLTTDRVSAIGYGRIDHNTTGMNIVRYATAQSLGIIQFSDDTTGNLVDYSTADSGGTIRFRGTSADGRVHRSTVESGRIDVQDSNEVQVYYTEVTTIGYVHIRQGSNTFRVYYSTFDGYGRMLVEQASSGRVLGVSLSGTAYVRLRAHANDLRYSTFDSYFYYYLTGNTLPKQGLNGSGRQTYVEPNPTTTVTGPGVRNW